MQFLNSKLKQHLNTGEFAKLAGINKKTLFYYDEIGLFKPDYVAENGYRFYSIFQMDQLALILTLKDLGVSLKDIQKYFKEGDVSRLNTLLTEKESEIDTMIQTLQKRKKHLQNCTAKNMLYAKNMHQGIQIESHNEVHYKLLSDDFHTSTPFLINYITDGPEIGIMIHNSTLCIYQKNSHSTHIIPKGSYLCYYSDAGSFCDEISPVIEQMQTYAAEHNLQIDDNFYMEYNEIMIHPHGKSYYCMRVRIINENFTANSCHL